MSGASALWLAVNKSWEEGVNLLLKHGADVMHSTKVRNGETIFSLLHGSL